MTKPKSFFFFYFFQTEVLIVFPNPAFSPVFPISTNSNTVQADNLRIIILNSFLYLTPYIHSIRQGSLIGSSYKMYPESENLTLCYLSRSAHHFSLGFLHSCSDYYYFFHSWPTAVLSPKSSQVILRHKPHSLPPLLKMFPVTSQYL